MPSETKNINAKIAEGAAQFEEFESKLAAIIASLKQQHASMKALNESRLKVSFPH